MTSLKLFHLGDQVSDSSQDGRVSESFRAIAGPGISSKWSAGGRFTLSISPGEEHEGLWTEAILDTDGIEVATGWTIDGLRQLTFSRSESSFYGLVRGPEGEREIISNGNSVVMNKLGPPSAFKCQARTVSPQARTISPMV